VAFALLRQQENCIMSRPKPLYVIIGADKDGKPRAARYQHADAITVAKAAAMTGFRIARAFSVKARAASKQLPEVQLFASGRALVPRVKQSIFKTLGESLTFPVAQPCATPATPQKRSEEAAEEPEQLDGLVRNPWGAIKQGSLVLAEETEDGGWYEAVVVSSKGQMLSLRWRDWPKLKVFSVPRTAVAIAPSRRPQLASLDELRAEAEKLAGPQAPTPTE
jgi:hypothetical protein